MKEKCTICGKKPWKYWWGGVKICDKKSCKDKAWENYKNRPARRNGETFGTG